MLGLASIARFSLLRDRERHVLLVRAARGRSRPDPRRRGPGSIATMMRRAAVARLVGGAASPAALRRLRRGFGVRRAPASRCARARASAISGSSGVERDRGRATRRWPYSATGASAKTCGARLGLRSNTMRSASAPCGRSASPAMYGSSALDCAARAARARASRSTPSRSSTSAIGIASASGPAMRERRRRLEDHARVFLRGPHARRGDASTPAPTRRDEQSCAAGSSSHASARRRSGETRISADASAASSSATHRSPAVVVADELAASDRRPSVAMRRAHREVRRRQQPRDALRPFDQAHARRREALAEARRLPFARVVRTDKNQSDTSISSKAG